MGIVDFEEVLDEDVWMCVEVGAVVMVDCKVEITGNEGITIYSNVDLGLLQYICT